MSTRAPSAMAGGKNASAIPRSNIGEKLPLMMHAAESQAEKSFMLDGLGRFAEGLKARGIEWQAPGISTIEYLAQHGILETKPLLAHFNARAMPNLNRVAARRQPREPRQCGPAVHRFIRELH